MRAKESIVCLFVFLAIWTAGGAAAQSQPTTVPTKIDWLASLEVGMKQARQSDRLVMIDFYTDWCGWCKVMDKDTYTDKSVIQLSDRLVPVKLNAEHGGQDAARKYRVWGYPTILFLSKDGETFGKIVGHESAKDFAESIRRFVQGYKEFPALKAAYAKNPNDLQAAFPLLSVYSARADTLLVDALLNRIERCDPEDRKGFFARSANIVGDMYQANREYDKAVPYFRMAAQAGKNPKDVAYAHLSLGIGYVKLKRQDEALSELVAAVSVENAPQDLVDQAKSYLVISKDENGQ